MTRKFILALTTLAGVSVFLSALLVTVNVLLRATGTGAIFGLNEVTQILISAGIILAFPLCTIDKKHIEVDIIYDRLGPALKRIFAFIGTLLSCLVVGSLLWRAQKSAFDAAEYGESTTLMQLPLWPLWTIMAMASALALIGLVIQVFNIIVIRMEKP